MTPKFITIEGIEGVGKTTCLNTVETLLRQANIDLCMTREPGGTPIAEAIRNVILSNHDEVMANDTELLLVFAARAQHIARVVRPCLAKGQWVVSDRFTDASYAYQGGGRGIALQRIQQLEQWVQKDLRPDLTLLLDAPLNVAFSRAQSRSLPDRIEMEGRDFFENVRKTYLQRAEAEPERYQIINANQSLAAVNADIEAVLREFINHS